MKTQIRFALATLLFISAPAFAQDDDEETTTTDKVEMQVGVPGMPGPMNMNMNMNVKVKTRTTTRRTTTTTTTDESEPGPAPAPAPAMRGNDCGAGEDSGCTMRRNGNLPMDYESFRGFLDSLKNSSGEINKNDIAQTTLKSDFLTAKQLGLVLDQFSSEIYKFDVAKAAAPRLVNPKHAMGLSSKFSSSIYATDFSKLMASQR